MEPKLIKNLANQGLSAKAKLFWPPLIKGTLLKRYKRFLADIKLDTGDEITAHCPNTGSMKECCEPGRPVYVSQSDNPKRKLKYTWELIEMPTSLVGTNTLVPNRLVFQAIREGAIDELQGYDTIKREVSIGNHTRIDLVLKRESSSCYIEIKNCTLVSKGVAQFPDAVTERGLKHLKELQKLSKEGHRAAVFFFVQRMDATVFRTAKEIDPVYSNMLKRVHKQGVEVLVYDVAIDLEGISINKPIPYDLS
jgi:sugar fermentation stimulation protein A